MSKDGRNCMLNSSPQSKTGLTVADPSENSETIHKIASPQDPQDFTVGKRVYVGGTRPGVIAYIGETHFAPGDWVGIVLDDPSGKNDGCVAGKRYFQCEQKRGVFSRLNRLSLTQISESKRNSTSELDFDMDRSRIGASTATSTRRDPIVGDRVIVSSGLGSRLGELKFLGETQFAAGTWCGIQLDEPNGKNDGTVADVKYFECPPKYGIFVPIAKVSLSPLSKKGNMSRMGSRESLTSVGTVNSVATTNTSRLRMSMLKRPSQNIVLPPTPNKNPPKPIFSMQDMIREKQTYIEQLMTERELDREDVQNQNMRHHKEIDEMKEKISVLEIKLEKTKKKNEELKNSIDEATFCGDELNAQNQVFREKIIVLEKKLVELDPNAIASIDQKLGALEKVECKKCTDYFKEIVQLKNQIENLVKELEKSQIQIKNTDILVRDSGKLEIQLNEKNIKISDLESNVIQLESDKEFLEIEFKKLKEESNEIMKIISQKDIETNHYQTKLEQLDTQNSELNSKIDKSTEINIDLESEILQLKDKLKSLQTDLDLIQINKLKAESSEIEIAGKNIKELEEKKNQIIELENKLTQFQTDNENLKKELKFLKDNSSETEKLKEIVLKESSEKLKILESENVKLNKKIQEIEIKNQNLIIESDKYISEIHSQKEQLNLNLQNENTNIKKCSELELHIKTQDELIKKETENKENLVKKNEEREKNITDLKIQNEALTIKIQELTQNLTETTTVESDLTERIKNLEIQNAELNNKIQETEKIKENLVNDLEKNTTELSNQKLELNTMIENKDIGLNKISELQLANKNLLTQITDKELESNNRINELEKMVNLLKAEKEISIKSLEKVKEDCIEIKNSMSLESIEYNKKLEDIETKNNEYQMKISEISKSKEILELDMGNLKKKYDIQETELKAALTSKENEKKTNDNLSKDITEKEIQLKEITKRMNELESELRETKMNKESLENNYKKLTEDSENMKKVNREKTSESNDFKFKSETLQNENNDLNDKLKETIDINKNLELEIHRLSSQLNNLSSALNSKETENKELNQLMVAHKIIQDDNTQKDIQLNDKNTKITELQQNIAQIKNEKDNLHNQLHKIQEDLIEIEKLRIEESNDYKVKLEANKTENTEANKKLLDQIKNLESKLSSESNELNNLQEAHKIVQENSIQNDNQLKEKIQIISDLEINIKKIKDDLDKELKLNEDLVQELNQLKEKLKISEQNNNDVNNTILEKNENVIQKDNQLKEKIQIISDLQIDIKKVKDDLGKELKLNTDLVQELSQLKENLKISEQSNNDLNSTVLEKNEIIKDIQINLVAFETKSQEFEEYKLKLEEKIKELNDINQELTINIKNEQSKFTELQQNVIENENELSEKEIKISELEKIITEEKKLINNYEEIKNSIAQESTEYKLKLEDLEKQNKNSSETNQILQSEIEKLTNKIQIQNTEIEKSTNKIEELTTENFDLQIKCSETNDALLKIQSDYQNIQTISNTLSNKYENELNIEKSELEKADKAVHEIRNELDKLQESNKKLIEENEEHKKTIKLMELEKQDAINNAEMLQIESEQALEQIKGNNNEYKKEFEKLKQEILHSKNVIDLTNKDLKDKITLTIKLENELSKIRNQSVTIPRSMEKGDSNDSVEQINFLNSIIADMHKKNENLISRIEALESPASINFLDSASLEILNKRKPAPRLFCDICDEFDAHDTEDCPIQASDDSPPNSSAMMLPNSNKIKPPPRKYCESCEEFGHETDECPNGECF